MRGHAGAASFLRELSENPDPMGISSITVMQLYHGVARTAVGQSGARSRDDLKDPPGKTIPRTASEGPRFL